MTTGKPKMPLIENCALCRVCGKGELSCSCDKPEPMSVDEAILLVLTGLGTERRQVAEVIRSLDERARRAERNFEQAAACHKEALCWYNEAKAQVAAQEQSHRDILQSVGEEATRQIAELTKDQEDWRKGVGFISACLGLDTLSTVDLGERALEIRAAIAEKDKRIAELEKAVDVLGWQCDKHRGHIAELEAALSGGTM